MWKSGGQKAHVCPITNRVERQTQALPFSQRFRPKLKQFFSRFMITWEHTERLPKVRNTEVLKKLNATLEMVPATLTPFWYHLLHVVIPLLDTTTKLSHSVIQKTPYSILKWLLNRDYWRIILLICTFYTRRSENPLSRSSLVMFAYI